MKSFGLIKKFDVRIQLIISIQHNLPWKFGNQPHCACGTKISTRMMRIQPIPPLWYQRIFGLAEIRLSPRDFLFCLPYKTICLGHFIGTFDNVFIDVTAAISKPLAVANTCGINEYTIWILFINPTKHLDWYCGYFEGFNSFASQNIQ